jgi:hypothetical protein
VLGPPEGPVTIDIGGVDDEFVIIIAVRITIKARYLELLPRRWFSRGVGCKDEQGGRAAQSKRTTPMLPVHTPTTSRLRRDRLLRNIQWACAVLAVIGAVILIVSWAIA